MRLTELVKIDNRFEKSVNLLLDLNSQDKIDGYIPTRSSVKILGEYIDEVKSYSGNRASVLIGPYGKGKSHLLLVLLTILAQSCQQSALDKLLNRIELVNSDVSSDIREIMSNDGVFLPVIINAGTGTLNQAFMKGLTYALERDGLSDVIPDNYYSEAIRMIENWKQNFPDTYKALDAHLDTTVPEFINALERFNENSLEKFREVYPALTSGGVFNPVVDNEIISVYRSVNRVLCEKHGYAGIYIVFDEFSKYIEGHTVERFAEDMKVLQDMCELCNTSKDEQLHLTCVAHKSIKAYGNTLHQEVLNAFMGVEGRLKEVYFVVSSQNNYELISDAIGKKPAFANWAAGCDSYKEIIEQTYTLKVFSSLFTPDDYNSIVGRGCFPLTPVAAMLLLNLSEKIAQNERTIFTYITSKDKDGLARTVSKSKNVDFVGVDSVYNYFISLFKEDTATGIHHEWLKADYALTKTEDSVEQAIIKSIAVIHMVNKLDDIVAKEKYISLSLGLTMDTVSDGLARLTDKKLVEYKNRTGTYEFKNNIGIDIELAIADTIAKRFAKVDVCSVLAEVVTAKFILPKKHNTEFCITRYFNYAFMTVTQFMNMKTTKYLEWNNQPDGVIAMIVSNNAVDADAIAKHTEEIGDPCLVVCVPNHIADCTEKVKYLLAVRSLSSNSTFIEDNVVIKKELDDIISETEAELNSWFIDTFSPVDHVFSSYGELRVGTHGINRLISDICDKAYPDTPIINHELINRHDITSQIIKARNTILTDLINNRDTTPYETGTSAESTIFRATMIHTKGDVGLSKAKAEIEKFISSCVDRKVSFSQIIDILIAPPYGMRKGVIAFYILDSLLRLEDMPVIYLNNKEVIFDVETINNILKKPENYFLYIEPETVQKNNYINGIETLFSDFSEYCHDVGRRNKLAKISCMMQSWYRSLPQTSLTFTEPDYKEQDMKQLIAFRKLFMNLYLNPHEVILERIPRIFKTENLEEILKHIKHIRKDIDAHIHNVSVTAIVIIRTSFGFDGDMDLRRSLMTWYENLPEIAKNSILSSRAENLISYIKLIATNDEEEIASKIVYETTGTFIEDWKSGSDNKFKDELNEILTEVLSKKNTSSGGTQKIVLMDSTGTPVEKFYDFDSENLSSTATFFRSALEDMIEEYDGVLENNEKIGVLMDAIKKMMG